MKKSSDLREMGKGREVKRKNMPEMREGSEEKTGKRAATSNGNVPHRKTLKEGCLESYRNSGASARRKSDKKRQATQTNTKRREMLGMDNWAKEERDYVSMRRNAERRDSTGNKKGGRLTASGADCFKVRKKENAMKEWKEGFKHPWGGSSWLFKKGEHRRQKTQNWRAKKRRYRNSHNCLHARP